MTQIKGYLVAAAALSTLPLAANAEDVMPKFTISAGYSHALAVDRDVNRKSDDGMGFFVGVGVPVARYLDVEFSAYHHGYGDDAPSRPLEWKENGAQADFNFVFSRNRLFSPYVGIGGGFAKNKIDNASPKVDDSTGFFDAGLGFKSYPLKSTVVGLTFDARYRWTKSDDLRNKGWVGDKRMEDVVLRAGLVVPFGLPAAPVAAPQVAEVAPPPPPATEPKQPTLAAERRFTDVLFAFDHSDLSTKAQGDLDSAVQTINELSNQYPNLRVKVDGHTDWIGTDGYNQGLGERRANTVKSYLVRKGVSADRIDTNSYGESKPVASNETAEGRQLNRRAEVRTTDGK